MKNAEASVVCDESTESGGQVNDEQQCVCSSLRNTVMVNMMLVFDSRRSDQ